MPILSVDVNIPGMEGVVPKIIFINTDDTIAEVLVAGYLNKPVKEGIPISVNEAALVATRPSDSSADVSTTLFDIVHSNGNWSLVAQAGPGQVTLPTIANHIATYTNVTGTLSEDPATAISGGNIQAGLSGTAGYLASFPSAAAKGSLRVAAVANTGDTLVTISNAAQGQASVYSIPDGGQAASNFIISDSAGTQNINTGSLDVVAGNVSAGSSGHAGFLASFPSAASTGSLELVAVANSGNTLVTISNASHGQASVYSIPDSGAATANFITSANAGTQHITSGSLEVDQGNVIAGSSGHAGFVSSFPSTASTGSLELVAVSNSGNTLVTISNDSHAQASVYSIPDCGNAIGQFLVGATATPFTTGHLMKASGTAGVVADVGAGLLAKTTASYGGGGTSNAFTATGLTSSSIVTANILTSTNSVSITKCVPGTNILTITFSADPGAATTVNYIAFSAAI